MDIQHMKIQPLEETKRQKRVQTSVPEEVYEDLLTLKDAYNLPMANLVRQLLTGAIRQQMKELKREQAKETDQSSEPAPDKPEEQPPAAPVEDADDDGIPDVIPDEEEGETWWQPEEWNPADPVPTIAEIQSFLDDIDCLDIDPERISGYFTEYKKRHPDEIIEDWKMFILKTLIPHERKHHSGSAEKHTPVNTKN